MKETGLVLVTKFDEPIMGQAWCFGHDVNTDLIYPGKYLSITEPTEMAKCALAGLDPNFGAQVKTGDIIVAGANFGCGSSREQAAICLKYAGISAVIAVSFARIFYRNIINQGVPALTSEEAIESIKTGDKIELNIQNGEIKNLTSNQIINFEPIPEFLLGIVADGGLILHLKNRL
jgi:3-isopropylmalate/(R)-2-methylmalate dehydratase small subunit